LPEDDHATPKKRSSFSHYLPRLKRDFYLADAVVFWTLPIAHRDQGWLNFRGARQVGTHQKPSSFVFFEC
jgi:hypothetical protein